MTSFKYTSTDAPCKYFFCVKEKYKEEKFIYVYIVFSICVPTRDHRSATY